MLNAGKIKLGLVSSMALVFLLMLFSSGTVAGQTEPFSAMEERLTGLSDQKREVLENLFAMEQEIEEAERAEEAMSREMETMHGEIAGLEKRIADGEAAYDQKRDTLKQVLRTYQRLGPGSYIEIILDAENLTMLLRRINTLRDLTRNTGELLDTLEESRERLSAEKAKLGEKLALLQEKQEQLRASLRKKLQLKEDQEKYLASLEKESADYREYLGEIRQVWGQLKPLFQETTKEISRIIAAGSFPPDALKTTFTFPVLKGSLGEETFNGILKGHAGLPEIVFRFHPGKAEMSLPQQNLVLTGTFVIQEGDILKFQAQEGSFYGLPLEAAAIEDLFRDDALVFNFHTVMGGSILQGIHIQEGSLELEIIIPTLFK
ncbi:coiled-coil domain-containing protein [Candidatus Formimonas warabiya]|uniref:Uncharacterized protein n=1 Tax=Formimonas warabiya TaxID=1761012 RepID=A0A3G1KTX4_FORW1|nr:hypothetical protein [Candidatus Formimonas warabiya]ATW25909.1 hypothetical protein DCMF_15010 [Candidatus Formimonas warabiya]